MLKVQNQHIQLTTDKSDIGSFNHKITAVACFIEAEHKILLLKTDSANKLQNYVWGVPGGKLESGETPNEAAVRELHEETGIKLKNDQLEFVIKLYVRAKGLDYEFYIYKSTLGTAINETTIVIDPKDHSSFVWLSPKDALSLELIYGEKELIEFLYPQICVLPGSLPR